MTLLQRAQSISTDICGLSALQKRAQQAELFERRANELEGPAVSLRKLEPSIAIFLELQVPANTIDTQSVAAVKGRIKDLRSRYLLDKNVMIDPFPKENIRYVLYGTLDKLPTTSGDALLQAWDTWSRRQLPSVDDDVLTLLEKIEALRPSALIIRQLGGEAEGICSSLPTDREKVARLTTLGDNMRETWHNLTGEGIPLAVLAFLRRAITIEGAKLQDLTQEVLDWMSKHGLSNSLRVRVG